MTHTIQTLLSQIALDDTQRTNVRASALECVEWLKQVARETREDAHTWTHHELKNIPVVSAHYERVREFMQRAGQDTPLEYTELDEETRALRARLILEEALETIEALGYVVALVSRDSGRYTYIDKRQSIVLIEDEDGCMDIEGVIDGLTDLSVVTVGTFISMGLPDMPFLVETDRANLEKFEPPKCPHIGCDHNEPMLYHHDIEEWVCHGYHNDTKERFLPKEAGPYKRADGKWIKPPYHTPPNHTRVAHSLGIDLDSYDI